MSKTVKPLSAPIDKNALIVGNLCKSFKGQKTVDSVSFDLRERDVLGIIGPSGSGKTTLLKCLNLIEIFDSGSIDYFEKFEFSKEKGDSLMIKDFTKREKRPVLDRDVNYLRQEVGLVFQSFNLWDEKTVLQNLTLAPIIVRKSGRLKTEEKALDLCRQFSLEDKIHTKVWQLSGGQRQRAAIIRALMMEPKILLLDEITSALDPVLTFSVMQAVAQLRLKGLSMIIVTHHLEFASSICDRIMFLSKGSVVQIDTPEGLRNSPATEEVEIFLDVLRSAR